VPSLILLFAKGREYYVAGAYPMLYASGAVVAERRLATVLPSPGLWRKAIWAALVLDALIAAAFTLPVAPVNSAWFKIAKQLNGDFVEEIGWPELVQTVAQVRDSLPAAERVHLGILGANYGEAGAINLYGPQYGLPRAISGANSFWYRGYGDPPPETLIVVGLSQAYVERTFTSCRLAAHTWNRFGVANEETVRHPDIFLCGAPVQGWPEFWKHFQYYG